MYALKHVRSGELMSKGGRVLVHGDRAELEWLIPGSPTVALKGDTVEEVAGHLGRPVMLWKDHPDMGPVRWPLNREDFMA